MGYIAVIEHGDRLIELLSVDVALEQDIATHAAFFDGLITVVDIAVFLAKTILNETRSYFYQISKLLAC